MAKLIKPDRGNRDQCVAALWKRLKLEDAVTADTALELGWLADDLKLRRTPQLTLTTQRLAQHWLDKWVLSRWNRAEDPDRTFAKAFAYFYWGREILLQFRQAEGWSDDTRDEMLHELLEWQGLAIAAGQEWYAERVAPYLHRLCMSGTPGTGRVPGTRQGFFCYDEPALQFTQALQRTLISGQWPGAADLAGMGSYAALFANADRPDQFREALVEFCDYRIAECFGYHGIDATKRRRPSVFESVLDRGSWDQVYPVELLTFQYAFGKATGRQLSLDAPHPLLRTILMITPLPPLVPFFEDDLTSKLKQYGQSVFGPAWRPRGLQ
jgi:hypothetical protein